MNRSWTDYEQVSTCLNTSSVRLEILGRILSGEPALNGVTLGLDLVLGHVQLGQSATLCNLDLGGHQINPVKTQNRK